MSPIQELLPVASNQEKSDQEVMKGADMVSISILVALAGPVVWWLWSRDLWFGWFSVGLFGANAIVAGLKRLFGIQGFFGRPASALGCDLMCVGGAAGKEPGFPSGHMTTIAMAVSGIWYHTGSPVVLWIGVPWIFAMGWARWAKSCHNWQQILAGSAFGWTCGYVAGLY